jgi:hypothetical protein
MGVQRAERFLFPLGQFCRTYCGSFVAPVIASALKDRGQYLLACGATISAHLDVAHVL